MADRLQYPLLPPYIQQQPQQQQQQQNSEPHSSLSAFPDNPRMWQHIQQMRSHPPDISSVQSHPQLADLFRNQSIMRLQQAQSQTPSQQFSPGLGIPQLATNQNINGPQQPFQDLSANQPQPPHMSPVNFNGMSNPNSHMGSAAQARNNSLLQNFSRSYDLPFSQSQHPQNGALAFGNKQGLPSTQQQARDQQHMQATNHSPSADMFSSPTMQNDAVRRPSPSHPQHLQNGMMPSTGPQNSLHPQSLTQSSVPFTSRPLPEQAMYLRNMIQSLNNSIAAQRPSPSDADPMTKARLTATLMSKKDAMTKLLNNVLAALKAQNGGGQGQIPWMQQQQQQQQPGPSQPSFDTVSLSRNGLGIQPPQAQVQHQPGNANPLVHPTQVGQAGGQNLQSNTSSVQGSHVNVAGSPFSSQAIVPPNAPSFNIPSTGLVQQQVQRATTQPAGMHNPLQMIPPLEKSRFDLAFKSFCTNKQINIDHRLVNINNRPIDLHVLHTLVMREGGEAKIQQKDLWSVIGGRMGFVQFPGTDSEPAKSGPVIAQQLEHIYRQYLADFDRAYIANVLDSRIKNGLGPLPFNASQLSLMVSMADQSVAQLKSQGLSEPMIQFIETHRAHLQRLRRDRDSFHDVMKSEQNAQGQVNGVSQINQVTGLRPTPFLQPGQSNIAQPSGHNMEVRPQLTHQLQSHATVNRPGKEQLQNAVGLIAKAKQETMNSNLNRPSVNIPAEQRFEYNTLIDQLFRQASEIDKQLPMLYIYTRKEEVVRRIILVVTTVQQQRSLLSSPNPRYFVPLDNLRVMHQQLQQATEMCAHVFTALAQQKMQLQQQQIQSGPRPVNTRNSFLLDTSQSRPPGASNQLLPSPNLQPLQPQPTAQQPTPPQIPLHPPQKKKGPTPALPIATQTAASTPSPVPASAHTPGPANAPSSSTLNHTPAPSLPPSSSSPPVPRSPKGKTVAKSKQAPAPTPKRRPSKAAPPPVLADSPAPSSSITSVKRAREEDDSVVDADSVESTVNISNEPSPPKRVKTEWETPPNEELKKKATEVKIESTDDAHSFFEQMTELLRTATDSEGQESPLYADLSETLGMIIKGCASLPEASDNGLAFGDAITGRESSPSTGFKDAFEEFIDYSFGQPDDEEGSKAHTPDLVPSSTNPSPESNTDGEHSLCVTTSLSDIQKDDRHDLRLGLWKEFDGGESAYYQPFEWKWDGPMPVLEQSWAVGTS